MVALAIPEPREGSYFAEWLLERRKRTERALTSMVSISYVLGVSTRRIEQPVEQLGITGLSRCQVSVLAKNPDEQVEALARLFDRSLDANATRRGDFPGHPDGPRH